MFLLLLLLFLFFFFYTNAQKGTLRVDADSRSRRRFFEIGVASGGVHDGGGHIGAFCATSTSATLSPCGLRRRSGTVSRPNPSSRSSLLPVLAGVVGVFSSWIFFYVRRHSLASSTSSLSFRCIRQGFVPDAISVEIDERRKSKVTANTTETRNRARRNLTAT